MSKLNTLPVIDPVATGKRIEQLRKENGMSVKQLQKVFGFTSPQSIYKWQWGQTLPDIANLLVLARIWNVAVEDIICVEE